MSEGNDYDPGIIFTPKDWARLVYEELKELQDKIADCRADTRDLPTIKQEIKDLTAAVEQLSDDVLTIQVKAKASAAQRALWVSIITAGAIGGIELIIQLVIK